jgi:plastocyanin
MASHFRSLGARFRMNQSFRIVAGLCVVLQAIAWARGQTTNPTTQPTTRVSSTVQGMIKLPSGALVSEIVVYLSPAEGQTITPPSETARISQKCAKFRPELLVICVGQTVEFLNDEDRPIEHNVFSNSPTSQFDLGLFGPGENRLVTFQQPGAVLLYCSVHRHMDGVIYVAPSPYFCIVSLDANRQEQNPRYEIDDVPPRRWRVQTWQHRRRYLETQADVMAMAGQICRQDLELGKK